MHKYLRAIGFSKFNQKSQVDKFLKTFLSDENLVQTYKTEDKRLIGQYNIKINNESGLAVLGEDDKKDFLDIDCYYPYVRGYEKYKPDNCVIERHSYNETYAGVIEDSHFDMVIIFHLINSNEYASSIKKISQGKVKIDNLYLSALSIQGTIILPLDDKKKEKNQVEEEELPFNDDIVKNDRNDIPNFFSNNSFEQFSQMERSKANVIELDNLDFLDNELFDEENGDIDIHITAVPMPMPIQMPIHQDEAKFYRSLDDRYRNEDLYAIVETSMVPYSIECDKYMIIGNILSVMETENIYTNEKMIYMRIETLGLHFSLMINEKDLVGEPKVGRRFRGMIWLMGSVDFSEENKSRKIK